MPRRLALVLLLGASSVTGGCETAQDIAGVCIATPFLIACGAGVVAGACTRCYEGPSSGEDAAAPAGESPIALPPGGVQVAY